MGLYSDVLLTVDYDRTLTDTNAVVPQRNLEAIRYFMDNGGTFTVNSGRSLPMARIFRDSVPVNAPLLLYNGSAWYDTKEEKLMNARLIDLDPVTAVYDLQARFPELTIEIQGLYHHHIFKKNAIWEDYNVSNGSSWEYTTPDQTGPFIKFAVYGYFMDNKTSSMYQFTPHEERLFNEAIAYIEETWGDKLELFRA